MILSGLSKVPPRLSLTAKKKSYTSFKLCVYKIYANFVHAYSLLYYIGIGSKLKVCVGGGTSRFIQNLDKKKRQGKTIFDNPQNPNPGVGGVSCSFIMITMYVYPYLQQQNFVGGD